MSTLVIQGTITELPDGGVRQDIGASVGLARPAARRPIPLTSDAPVAVNLDGWDGLHVIDMEADGLVTAVLTSDAGTSQAIPFDDRLLIVSRRAAYTALSLVRAPGQSATVIITLGQAS